MIKNLLVLLIILNFIGTYTGAAPLIVDEFVEQTLDVAPIEQYDKSKLQVEDELIDKIIPKQKVLTLEVKKDNVIDDTALKIDKKKVKPVKSKTKYNYAIAPIPIKLRVTENLSTRNNCIKEGDLITFKTINPEKLGKYLLPRDSEVIGRVETISPNDLLGTPADLIIDNFFVKNNEKINFHGCIKKRGANRSWWIYPIYQAGNLVLWAAGYPLILVRGGHAKLRTKDVYTVYYEQQ